RSRLSSSGAAHQLKRASGETARPFSFRGMCRSVDRMRRYWSRVFTRTVAMSRSNCCGIARRQRNIQRLIHGAHEVELDPLEQLRLKVLFRVGLVVRRKNDLVDSGPLGTQHLLLDPADWKHHARERNLPGHGHARAHGPAAQQAHERGHHCQARRGPVLRYRARGHMDVDVLPAEEVRVDAVALGVRSPPGKRRGHGLLHHLAQMAGHGELLAPAHAASLDEQDVAARWGPSQAHGNAWPLDALFDFLLGAELRHAQHLADNLRRDDELVRLALSKAPRLLADQRGNLALEVTHAGFAREAVDDLAQTFDGELDLFAHLDAVFAGLPGDQVLGRDVNLLLLGVAGELNDLHAVAQRLRNRIDP